MKAGAGGHLTKPLPGEEVRESADIIDLTELLRRSLRGGAAGRTAEEADAEAPKAKSAGSRRKAANDEEHEAPGKRAAATKSTARSTTTMKPKPRKKAA